MLGALLLDGNAYSKVSDTGLEAFDFYREAHGKIFEAIQDLVGRAEPVDLITLSTNLQNRNTFEQVGGSPSPDGSVRRLLRSAHVTHYSKIVNEKAILRRMISTGQDLVDKPTAASRTSRSTSTTPRRSIFEVTDTKLRQSFSPIKQDPRREHAHDRGACRQEERRHGPCHRLP